MDFKNSKPSIEDVKISEIMEEYFLKYSMSVITSRALPDVRDGLKPVHRRILHSMNELGIIASRPYKKSARIVGDVIGKYHPHGDTAVYDAMVRMSQDFSYRYELVQGHGNFGSIDGDGAAAMRYTEARMSKIAMEMMRDINKDTVNFVPNYDEEETEPSVLPARFPNLLVNGSMGIAVGMATNIAPHNLNETIDACLAIMDNPDITVLEIMEKYMFGPDFPTGGIILGRAGIKQAFETGRGAVITRSRHHIEELPNGKKQIIVTEIPYQVNKANLVEKIASLVRDKFIEGITDLRDESNREGIRIVIELRKDVQEEVILNQLFRMTALQTSFSVNQLALVNGVPRQLGIIESLKLYVDHQIEVTERKTRFDLKKAEERAHILEGFRIALDHIDEIISIIRSSSNDAEATERLIEQFKFSDIQAKSILQMQLRRLTGLERDKIENEYQELVTLITDLKDILENHQRVLDIIKQDLIDVRDRFGDERRTEISDAIFDMQDEDLIPVEDVIITMSSNGYVKRLPVDTYRTQNRGGRGVKGMGLNEDDVIDIMISMSTHDSLLLFSNYGKVYRLKGYQIPNASRTSKGLPVVNLIQLDKDENITAATPILREDEPAKYLFFVTKEGTVKRTDIVEFDSIRQNGKIAIGIREGDELIGVKKTTGSDEIIIAGSNGKAVKFSEDQVRVMGRTAAGVRGFNTDGSTVVGCATTSEGEYLLSVSENGYGKRSELVDYRLTKRGAKGVKTMNVTEKTGSLISVRAVNGDEDAMIITSEGIIIRFSIENVGIYGRNTQGVKLINVSEEEFVKKMVIVEKSEEEDEELENEVEVSEDKVDNTEEI